MSQTHDFTKKCVIKEGIITQGSTTKDDTTLDTTTKIFSSMGDTKYLCH